MCCEYCLTGEAVQRASCKIKSQPTSFIQGDPVNVRKCEVQLTVNRTAEGKKFREFNLHAAHKTQLNHLEQNLSIIIIDRSSLLLYLLSKKLTYREAKPYRENSCVHTEFQLNV